MCNTPLNGPNILELKIGLELEDRFLKVGGVYSWVRSDKIGEKSVAKLAHTTQFSHTLD